MTVQAHQALRKPKVKFCGVEMMSGAFTRTEVAKILLVLKDVRARESSMELDAVVCPLLSFPCVFQVAPDKIVAFEQVMMQDFDAVILPLRCTETFTSSTFAEIVESMGGVVPKMIYMVNFDDVADDRDMEAILRLSPDSSIPLNELVRVITNAVVPSRVEDATETEIPAVAALGHEQNARECEMRQPIHAAIPYEAVAATKHTSKRKRDRAEVAGDHSSRHRRPAMAPRMNMNEQDPQVQAYLEYWQAVQAHQQWLAQQYTGGPTSQAAAANAKPRRRGAAPSCPSPSSAQQHKRSASALACPSAESDFDSLATCTTSDGLLGTSSSEAEAEAATDGTEGEGEGEEGFDYCLEGFEDMYGFLLDDIAPQQHQHQ